MGMLQLHSSCRFVSWLARGPDEVFVGLLSEVGGEVFMKMVEDDVILGFVGG